MTRHVRRRRNAHRLAVRDDSLGRFPRALLLRTAAGVFAIVSLHRRGGLISVVRSALRVAARELRGRGELHIPSAWFHSPAGRGHEFQVTMWPVVLSIRCDWTLRITSPSDRRVASNGTPDEP